jgi:hypothetical protein
MTAYNTIRKVAEEAGVPIVPVRGAWERRQLLDAPIVDLSVVGWKKTHIAGNAAYDFQDPEHPVINAIWGPQMSDGGKAAILAHELGHHVAYNLSPNDPLGSGTVYNPTENEYLCERNASWWGYTILNDALGEVTDEQRAYLNYSIYQRGTANPQYVWLTHGLTRADVIKQGPSSMLAYQEDLL